MRIELSFEDGDDHAGEEVALPERVGHRVLLARVDLRDHQQVVEQKHLTLVKTYKGRSGHYDKWSNGNNLANDISRRRIDAFCEGWLLI